MRWLWWRPAGPPQVVTGRQRDELDAAKRRLAEKEHALDAKTSEINRVTAFIERERRHNHFGERLGLAFGLDGRNEGNGGTK
jgi:hypothetical protein